MTTVLKHRARQPGLAGTLVIINASVRGRAA